MNFAYVYGKSLFRFSSYDKHFLSELRNRELHFSSPNDFNDPFDCQLEYNRVLREVLLERLQSAQVDFDSFINEIKKYMNSARVCCFSRARKNQLMWAHYAAKHTGVCIGFDTSILARETGCKFADVSYMAKHPLSKGNKVRGLLDELDLYEGLDFINNKQSYLQAVVDRLLSSKYSYWRYEREVRLITHNKVKKVISPKAITSVTIGLRASEPVKNSLYEVLADNDWQHVRLLKAEKKPEAYALQFAEIHRDSLIELGA